MFTYRVTVLCSLGITHGCTFGQALRWMDAYECYDMEKPNLRPKKKRASRLNKILQELQQPVPEGREKGQFDMLQPILCNSEIEAVLPCEPKMSAAGPFFASHTDSSLDVDAYATSAYAGWRKYRRLSASNKNEVFFSPLSPNYADGNLRIDRFEFATQAIQLSEIFTRMFCAKQWQERRAGKTFRRPDCAVNYTADSIDALGPEQFEPDAIYTREGQRVSVFLPCAFSWKPLDEFRQFIAWLVQQCESQSLVYELWQPGLIREIRA